jgi:hypothetical protein
LGAERALQRDRAIERSLRRGEAGKETVTHRLDLSSTVGGKRASCDPLVLAQDIAALRP